MENPRIIRALELIHEAQQGILPLSKAHLLRAAEDELLRHIAEMKRAEMAR